MSAAPHDAAYFVHWGVLQISLANLGVIALMVAIFVVAVLVQLPHREHEVPDARDDDDVDA